MPPSQTLPPQSTAPTSPPLAKLLDAAFTNDVDKIKAYRYGGRNIITLCYDLHQRFGDQHSGITQLSVQDQIGEGGIEAVVATLRLVRRKPLAQGAGTEIVR